MLWYIPGCPSPTDSDVNKKQSSIRELWKPFICLFMLDLTLLSRLSKSERFSLSLVVACYFQILSAFETSVLKRCFWWCCVDLTSNDHASRSSSLYPSLFAPNSSVTRARPRRSSGSQSETALRREAVRRQRPCFVYNTRFYIYTFRNKTKTNTNLI